MAYKDSWRSDLLPTNGGRTWETLDTKSLTEFQRVGLEVLMSRCSSSGGGISGSM